jgi:hypothetical protein
MTERNGLIEPENYYDGYNASAKKVAASQPEEVRIDELMFSVFGLTEDGQKLMNIFKERFIMPAVPCNLSGADFPTAAVYYEGYREAFRQIIGQVEGFKKRKLYEAKNAELEASTDFNGEY